MRHALTSRRGWGAAALAGLLGAALAGAAPSGPAGAAPLVSFKAVANADGMRQSVVRPDAPLDEHVVDASVPSAQAVVDGLGNSEAYGSFLYPGGSAISGPGLLSGVIGQSLPGYPLYASSTDPSTPKGNASRGPVTITADSSPTSSTGRSSFDAPGGAVGRLVATATSTVEQAAGKLSAIADTEATAVDVQGVLRMSSVHSSAKALLADGKVTATSSLEMGELSVAGVRVVLTDKGLQLPGQSVPLPDSSPVTKPLHDAGVAVSLVAPEKLPGGVRSGGVRVEVVQATPDGGSATTVYVFGQALATVTATSDPAAGLAPDVLVVPPPVFVPGPVTAPIGGGTGPVTAPDVPVPVTEPAPTTAPAPVTAPAVRAASTLPFARLDTLSFYLVLVLAGGVALAAQKALRRFGVSATWTS